MAEPRDKSHKGQGPGRTGSYRINRPHRWIPRDDDSLLPLIEFMLDRAMINLDCPQTAANVLGQGVLQL